MKKNKIFTSVILCFAISPLLFFATSCSAKPSEVNKVLYISDIELFSNYDEEMSNGRNDAAFYYKEGVINPSYNPYDCNSQSKSNQIIYYGPTTTIDGQECYNGQLLQCPDGQGISLFSGVDDITNGAKNVYFGDPHYSYNYSLYKLVDICIKIEKPKEWHNTIPFDLGPSNNNNLRYLFTWDIDVTLVNPESVLPEKENELVSSIGSNEYGTYAITDGSNFSTDYQDPLDSSNYFYVTLQLPQTKFFYNKVIDRTTYQDEDMLFNKYSSKVNFFSFEKYPSNLSFIDNTTNTIINYSFDFSADSHIRDLEFLIAESLL